jgi:hypothetical protein
MQLRERGVDNSQGPHTVIDCSNQQKIAIRELPRKAAAAYDTPFTAILGMSKFKKQCRGRLGVLALSVALLAIILRPMNQADGPANCFASVSHIDCFVQSASSCLPCVP